MSYENNNLLINKNILTKNYKVNFSKIIKKLKLKSDNEFDKYLIKYECNFCLLQKNIEIANKVNFLTLSSYIEYQNEKNINYILKIIKIIIKLMNFHYMFLLTKIKKIKNIFLTIYKII